MRFGPYATPGDPYNGTLISEPTYYNNEEAVIHIKGGPVTVHGTYKGRYTGNFWFDAIGGDESAKYEGWSTYYGDVFNSRFVNGILQYLLETHGILFL